MPASPVGPIVEGTAARLPGRVSLAGRYVTLEPLDPLRHAEGLWDAVRGHDALWTYLFDPPPADRAAFDARLDAKARLTDRAYAAIVDRGTGRPGGYASYLRMEPAHRCIEVGDILLAPPLQRTRGATEAMFLLARHVFEELGYRRCEWKCDALNGPSRRAAARLGFVDEGVFRQHMIVKGRSRDTAWFSMLDGEWPARRAAFERWLDPANFDAEGRQRTPLERAGRAREGGARHV